jgi:hypothetical protein
MGPGSSNGFYKDIEDIKHDVKEIKDDLSHSIDRLTEAVVGLTNKFDQWVRVAEHSIPLKAVFWMFVILVLVMTGERGVELLFRHYSKMLD